MTALGWVGPRIDRLRYMGSHIGFGNTARYCAGYLRNFGPGRPSPVKFTTPLAIHPLLCRPSTSDFSVFQQIYIEREYQCLDGRSNVDLVIDCGANVGYSSAYFLSRFPGARVVAVEPEEGNYTMLERNLSAYGDRVTTMRCGIWSQTMGLCISEARYRDGLAWSTQIRACRPGEPAQIQAVVVDDILTQSGADRISILKMDIEGAEGEVFAKGPPRWLEKVDALVIELHSDTSFGDCVGRFFQALDGLPFRIFQSGELTVCIRQ